MVARKIIYKPSPEYREFLAQKAEKRRAERQAVREFADAVRASDGKRTARAFSVVEELGQWTAAMRAVAVLPPPTNDFRRRFLGVWLSVGDSLRNNVEDDLVLIDALRVLLPPYKGSALKLYRGETGWNRRRRTYGLAWSTSKEVARQFAEGSARTSVGGSVLIETLAPAKAIICAPAEVDDRYGELEVLVDRKRLRAVNVLERFEQAPLQRARGTTGRVRLVTV